MQTFKYKGFTFTLDCEPDDDYREPWKECDGHGSVREVRHVRDDKRAGERVLYEFDRGHGGYLYGMAETMRIAKRDGWGLAPDARAELAAKLQREPTNGEVIAAAVERDYQRLRAWCRDDWCYVVLRVVLLDTDGDETSATDYLGGVESDSGDLVKDFGEDMADNIIAMHELTRKKYFIDGAKRFQISVSQYATIKNALIANRYADKDAAKIARRLAKRKDPIGALNEYLNR